MPTLDFKGKQFVYSHHLSVPFRELRVDAGKSLPAPGQKPSLDDNLIIHGDNLEALKALLPTHAGKIDCIFIDPPYNTGNEGWCYNDNVRSPLMKEWLKKSANPVDKEDLERHDKWLCMMWPRLNLLHELLDEDGIVFATIDDVEVHRMRLLFDEVFGEDCHLATFSWQSKDTPGNNSSGVAETHNYVIAYTKSPGSALSLKERSADQIANYSNPDNDPRGDWLAAPLTRAEFRERDYYPLTNPAGKQVYPPKGSSWRRPPAKMKWLEEDKRIWWGVKGNAEFPMEKKFLKEAKAGVVHQTWGRLAELAIASSPMDRAKRNPGSALLNSWISPMASSTLLCGFFALTFVRKGVRLCFAIKEASMTTITASEARAKLYRLMDDAASSHEPILITGKRANAVLLSEQDWASIQESLFLLSVPGMRESIVEGLKAPVEECARELDW